MTRESQFLRNLQKEHGIDDLGFSIHAIFFDYDKTEISICTCQIILLIRQE